MRRILATLAIVGSTLSLAACGDAVETVQDGIGQATEGVQEAAQLVEFCTAALDVARAVDDQDWDRAIERGEEMVAEAPDDIAADAQTVLDGAKRLRDGDTQVAQDESFQAAADRVEAYTRDHCNPTN